MKMRCPHCQVRGTATESLRGRVVRCPQCHQLFRVPAGGNESITHGTAVTGSDEKRAEAVSQGLGFRSSGSDRTDEEADRAGATAEGDTVEPGPASKEPFVENTVVADRSWAGQEHVPEEPVQSEEENEEVVPHADDADQGHDDSGMQEARPEEDPEFPDLSAQGVAWEDAEEQRDPQQVHRHDEPVAPEDLQQDTADWLVTEVEIADDLDALLAESCVACGKPLPHSAGKTGEAGDLCDECRFSGQSAIPVIDEVAENGEMRGSAGDASVMDRDRAADQEEGFTVAQVLKTSWSKIKGSKGVVWCGMLVMVLALAGVEALTLYVLPQVTAIGGSAAASWTTIVSQAVGSVLALIFMAGLMVVGVRRVSGRDYSWRTVFAGFAIPGRIAVAGFLMALLIVSGFILLILPGIYLSVGYSLTLPLMLERGYGPWQAMEASRQMIHPRWWQVFGVYLTMYVLYLVSCLPLGIGLVWTIPMFFILTGVIYQRLANRADLS